MRDYLICAPHYDRRSAGLKALYILCHRLNNLGYNAYITGDHRESGYNVKSLYSLSKEQIKDLQMNGVVVYADNVIIGNPLKFSHVARWFMGITQKTPVHELSFSFSPSHNYITKANYNLMLFDIESFFKFSEIENRTTRCFVIGKGGQITKSPLTKGCIEITAQYPVKREELAYLFQKSEIFYTYDNLSTLVIEGLLCGCPALILGYSSISKENFKGNVLNQYGVRYIDQVEIGKNGLPLNYKEIKEEIPKQVEIFNQLMENSKKELSNFIQITQNFDHPYVEDSKRDPVPHPWLALGFWPDFFSLFRER